MTRLFGEGNETRWRDPGVSICLRCPVGLSEGYSQAAIDAICGQADNEYTYGKGGGVPPVCPWAIARSILGGSIANLAIAETVAETHLHPDHPASVAGFTAALTEAAAIKNRNLPEAK